MRLDKLGEGTYGIVYKAQDTRTGQIVALKRMNLSTDEEGVPSTTIREIAILKEMKHANIVDLLDVLFQAPKLTLVFEYCEYDLKKYMERLQGPGHPMPLHIDSEVKPLLRQLLNALVYMHQRNVVHRDLKPQNLLLTDTLQLKLADFGLARVEGIPVKKYSHEAVTLWYRSPDVILGSTTYGMSVDMWSAGCVFAEMVTGVPLFNGKNEPEQMQKIFKMFGTPTREIWPSLDKYPFRAHILERPEFTEHFSSMFQEWCVASGFHHVGPDGVDLFMKMMQFEPSHRVTAAEACRHPFFVASSTSEATHSAHPSPLSSGTSSSSQQQRPPANNNSIPGIPVLSSGSSTASQQATRSLGTGHTLASGQNTVGNSNSTSGTSAKRLSTTAHEGLQQARH